MKPLAAIFLSACCVVAHAEDMSYPILSCNVFGSAVPFVRAEAASLRHPFVSDIAYFPARKGLTFNGLPVVAVFGFEHNSPLFPRGPGTAPPRMYGITIEGTQATGDSLVQGSHAQAMTSGVHVRGHEFVDISCTSEGGAF
ncbi:hypothetical protein [Burkholderia aenigmatica]|uniref:hypothetical protein n=1 Tax=Burkholderia aenigmatica TaxID=2015348 RepID=UPI00264EFB72|nr:hypothetical protein [Burkholderia aenigmatica]MDN7873861.1 hypothetical protein [Burkholderia aenigmatica]